MATQGSRSYHRVSVLVFAVVALVQLYRAGAGLAVDIGGFQVPVAFSWLAACVAGGLAMWGWRVRDA